MRWLLVLLQGVALLLGCKAVEAEPKPHIGGQARAQGIQRSSTPPIDAATESQAPLTNLQDHHDSSDVEDQVYFPLNASDDHLWTSIAERFNVIGIKPEVSHEPSVRFLPFFQPLLLPPFTEYGYIQVAYKERLFPPMIFGLFGRECPLTVHNFVTLLNSHKNQTSFALHGGYKGTLFHRIVPHHIIQGGRVINSRGEQGGSIYGKAFPDESFLVKHDRPGILSMCNDESDGNGSEFFMTVQRSPWFDRLHVPFGLLIYGFETLNYINAHVPTNQHLEMPLSPIIVYDCGTDVQQKMSLRQI